MTQKWTLAKAFAFFDGAAARNPRWCWSARSADGRTVVITLWRDQIEDDGVAVIINCFEHGQLHLWRDKPGNKQRTKDLVWARDHCDGLFRVVMVEAKDPKANPRTIVRRYPDSELAMKLVSVNEDTGEFSAEGTRNQGPVSTTS